VKNAKGTKGKPGSVGRMSDQVTNLLGNPIRVESVITFNPVYAIVAYLCNPYTFHDLSRRTHAPITITGNGIIPKVHPQDVPDSLNAVLGSGKSNKASESLQNILINKIDGFHILPGGRVEFRTDLKVTMGRVDVHIEALISFQTLYLSWRKPVLVLFYIGVVYTKQGLFILVRIIQVLTLTDMDQIKEDFDICSLENMNTGKKVFIKSI